MLKNRCYNNCMAKSLQTWSRLDNSAKIYPMLVNKKSQNIFRLSVTLKEKVDENILLPCGGLRPVLPELVAAGTALAAYGGHGILHRHAVCGLYMPAHGGYMDVPPVEEQPYG